ncbi:helix-turn-helix domain-containing protein [Anaerotignum propionicum]|uniref:HTH-type transcriptional regulator Xre n=1 Tax=Anaerotignum propionicum DSM 1682 TaxID=991789 RepID=A0A110A752_ANAPI|nr:helix-turn-helix transcriptional regulator [Anaerotignum propionicum]AMJ40497.1 HTH-type transcriptional regulator Xre [Anaerotignum propionicum DSM 1682]SHE40457.1 Helix-turn-helix [[Clostridium] propionicum DSM 1682] [Anaerotignum propionicum DSM 1682]
MNEISLKLKFLRESIGISQSKIAELIGTTQASINRYENAQSSPPLKTLLWYADFFDVSMDYIFGRTEQPQGKLYTNNPNVIEAVTENNKELKQFVDMCFDASSPISKKLKNMLVEMLQEGKQ